MTAPCPHCSATDGCVCVPLPGMEDQPIEEEELSDENWVLYGDGSVSVTESYGVGTLRMEASQNHEVLISAVGVEMFVNCLDLLEMVIKVAELADHDGVGDVLRKNQPL